MVGSTIQEWCGLIYSDTIWFDSKKEKKNACFYAAVEEVKHWKSLIHWTTQTFSTRPLFNLCGPQTQTWNVSLSWCFPVVNRHYLKWRCWCNMHSQNIWEWTGATFTTIYHKSAKKPTSTYNVWRAKYKAQNLTIDTINFCFEKWFWMDTSHIRM